MTPGALTPEQQRRYSRQIRVAGIGEAGQQRLLAARVLIVGMGGLGSPAALYLAAAGVGTLVVSDFDRVEDSNLQRQIIHRQADIGEHKAHSAKRALEALNPACQIISKDWQLDDAELAEEIHRADLVLDCSDNFTTRHAVNAACVAHRKPLVSGAAIRFDGQVTVFDLRKAESPCYGCLFPEEAGAEELRCAVMGVFAPLTGIIGTTQAAEALKLTAQDLDKLGIVDEVIAEPLGGAQRDPAALIERVGDAIENSLGELKGLPPGELMTRRRQKFMDMGSRGLS